MSIYQDSTEAAWGPAGEMARSRPLPSSGTLMESSARWDVPVQFAS